jgi:ferredoxin
VPKKIVVDRNRCTGLGMCEAAAPDVFEIQPDGSMVVLCEHPSDDQMDAVQEAVDGCPTEALSLVDD